MEHLYSTIMVPLLRAADIETENFRSIAKQINT